MALNPLNILAAVLFLIAIIFAIARRFTGPRTNAPSCGKCHYNLTGLSSGICPECGSSLSEVGVLHPDSRGPLGFIGRFAIWTCTLGPIAFIATPVILREIPPILNLQGSRQFSQPASGRYGFVSIVGEKSFRRTARQLRQPLIVRVHDLKLTLLFRNGSTSTMESDFDTMKCSFKDSQGKSMERPLAFNDDTAIELVLDWYAANGIPSNDSSVRREAAEIADALKTHYDFRNRTTPGINPPNYFGGTISITSGMFKSQRMGTNEPFQNMVGSTTLASMPDPWPPRLIIAGWALLWMLGIGLICLLKRRRSPTAAQAIATYTSPVPDVSIDAAESSFQTNSNSA